MKFIPFCDLYQLQPSFLFYGVFLWFVNRDKILDIYIERNTHVHPEKDEYGIGSSVGHLGSNKRRNDHNTECPEPTKKSSITTPYRPCDFKGIEPSYWLQAGRTRNDVNKHEDKAKLSHLQSICDCDQKTENSSKCCAKNYHFASLEFFNEK